jgi:hypothetical protein
MWPCVLLRDLSSKITVTVSVVIRFHGYDAPLVRAAKLLSLRAPLRISSDLVECVEGWPILLHRQGCLCTAVLYGTDRSMPAVWCSIRVEGDAVLFGGLVDTGRRKRCRVGVMDQREAHRWLTYLTVSLPNPASLPLSENHYNTTSLDYNFAISYYIVLKFYRELV